MREARLEAAAATMAQVTPQMSDEAAPVADAPVFKKPNRNRNIRKRGADDVDAGAGDAGGPGASLEVMRELQRQRQRSKGVSLELKGGQDVEDAQAADDADDHGLESTFTAQTDAGEADPSMLRYIEEQMKGDEGEQARPTAGGDDDGLYLTPAHLRGKAPADGAAAELEDAGRWLAGIMEVPLDAADKMASIEETEKAKRKMMAKQNASQSGGQIKMIIPTNYNANFHQHRREMTATKGGGKKAGGGGGPPVASDHNAVQSFRSNERDKQRMR